MEIVIKRKNLELWHSLNYLYIYFYLYQYLLSYYCFQKYKMFIPNVSQMFPKMFIPKFDCLAWTHVCAAPGDVGEGWMVGRATRKCLRTGPGQLGPSGGPGRLGRVALARSGLLLAPAPPACLTSTSHRLRHCQRSSSSSSCFCFCSPLGCHKTMRGRSNWSQYMQP